MRRRVAFAAGALMLALCTTGIAGTADTPQARMALAGKLVAETVTAGLVQNMTETLWPSFEAALKQQNRDITPEALAGFKSDLAGMQKNLFADVIVDMPAIYARLFTLEELEAIYAFQTSEVGRKSIALQPQIMGQMMPKMLSSIEANMPVIRERLRKRAIEKGYRL